MPEPSTVPAADLTFLVTFLLSLGVFGALNDLLLFLADFVFALPLFEPPTPWTLIVRLGVPAASCFGAFVWCPISTPTPSANSSVATPTMKLELDEIRGRRGGFGAPGAAAFGTARDSNENRVFPRRSPHSTQ